MYLKQSRFKDGRVHLAIKEKYRADGKVKEKTILNIGYLSEVDPSIKNPIAYYKDMAKKMTIEKKEANATETLTIDMNEKCSMNDDDIYDIGYMFPMAEYYRLGIHDTIRKLNRKRGNDFSVEAIARLLVTARITDPASKLKTFDHSDRMFERTNFEIHHVYRALSHLSEDTEKIQKSIHEAVTHIYGRDTSLGYYDCTNYYFEIHHPDDTGVFIDPVTGEPHGYLRDRGPSKEFRKTPIVQMGLLMDRDGIPMAYDLFRGNESEKKSLIPVTKRLRRDYKTDRVIFVADRGLNTGDNIFYNLGENDGYIFSKSVRGASTEIKKFVLEDEGYVKTMKDISADDTTESVCTFKIKSRIHPEELTYHDSQGRSRKCRHDQKQVVFWSREFAKRAACERDRVVEKAEKLIKNRGSYSCITSKGAAGYIKNLRYDHKTGEIMNPAEETLVMDEEKIKREAQFDGYYMIVTSELKMEDSEIIEKYRGLWRIEESFKITKSELEGRPVYVQTPTHIEGHFLVCFIALLITRLMQKRTSEGYSAQKIIDSIRKFKCGYIKENLYKTMYYDDTIEELNRVYQLKNVGKRWLTKKNIKEMSASAKRKS